jgi:diguanylate cyclase (GGDEF)-like protein
MSFARWFLPPEDQAYHLDLARELVRDLHQRARVGLLGLILFLFLLHRFLQPAIHQAPILGHLILAVGMLAVVRLGLTLALEQNPTWIQDPHSLHLLFIAQAFLTGCGLGWFNLLALEYLRSTDLALLCVCQLGITALAMVSMAASFIAYASYMLPNMLVLTFGLALHLPEGIPEVFPFILASFTAVSLYLASVVHDGLKRQTLLALKLHDAALKDSLTGLYNRRFVLEFMSAASSQILRDWEREGQDGQEGRSLGLYILDIDHFKEVNDSQGHAAGDAVLSQLAMVLSLASRKPDLVARWGGEEFLIVAQDVDRDHLETLGDRIRQEIGDFEFLLPNGKTLRITCSIGCAAFPFSPLDPTCLSWEGTLNLADAALYRSKMEGRNRSHVAVAGPHARGEALHRLGHADKDITLSSGERLLVIR